jgi:hypothetical protein
MNALVLCSRIAVVVIALAHLTTTSLFAQTPKVQRVSVNNIGSSLMRFQASPGNEGNPCSGNGLCKVFTHSTAKGRAIASSNPIVTGTLSLERGRLVFAPSAIACTVPLTLHDVKRLTFPEDMRIDAEIARSIGFSGIKIHHGVYPVDADGIATIRAEYSFGVQAAAVENGTKARIRFELLRDASVSILVSNAQGERVAMVLDNVAMKGASTVREYTWDAMAALMGNGAGTYTVEVRVQLPEGGSFAESAPLFFPTALASAAK